MGNSYEYRADVVWTGERRGQLSAPGLPAIAVAAPPEFKGHEGAWTPEHLFVGAVASCFLTTFLAVAELSRLEFREILIASEGRLEKGEGPGFRITEIVLRPRLAVTRPEDRERAARILEKAERNCFISSSITSTVTLEPEVLFLPEGAEALADRA